MRTVHALLTTITVVSAAAQQAAPDDWRAFRGTDGSATSASSVPAKWGDGDDDRNVAWRTALPGPGSSSPIVVGDRVFLTCWSGYGLDREEPGDPAKLRRHLLCFARDDGELLWERTVDPVATEDSFGGRMAVHGYASSTPVSDGEHVFVFFGKSGVHAFDLDGEPTWHADVGSGSSKWKTGSGSSPALWGDLLFINASDESASVRGLRKDTGKEVWRREAEELDQAYGTPCVASTGERTTVVIAMLGAIWGLEPETGKPRWTVKTITNGALAPSVVCGGDTVFSLGGQTRTRAYAIMLGGDGDVTDTHIAWSSRYGSYVTTPLFDGGRLHWVNEGGIAFCVDAASGELVYQERLEGTFYASVVRAGDVLLAVSQDNGTYVLRTGPEFEVLANNRLEGDDSRFDGTPAISEHALFLRSGRFLYCIATRD